MAAKAIAYATGAALVSVDGLHAVALSAPPDAVTISVVADAQRSELYVADFVRYVSGGPVIRQGLTHIESESQWVARIDAGTFVIGPGLASVRLRASLPAGVVIGDPEMNYPEGCRLIELARESWSLGRRESPWLLEPLYLRRSAAEDQWDSRSKLPKC
jgi:tRNA threonylcarbamoyladenosine biosynthesis protein TsaB